LPTCPKRCTQCNHKVTKPSLPKVCWRVAELPSRRDPRSQANCERKRGVVAELVPSRTIRLRLAAQRVRSNSSTPQRESFPKSQRAEPGVSRGCRPSMLPARGCVHARLTASTGIPSFGGRLRDRSRPGNRKPPARHLAVFHELESTPGCVLSSRLAPSALQVTLARIPVR